MSRRKYTDIPQRVKEAVWQRDGGRCVLCGNAVNVMPNAHIVARSHGGRGVETNIITLCTGFTRHNCHYRFDNASPEEKAAMMAKITEYMRLWYPSWRTEDQIYRR